MPERTRRGRPTDDERVWFGLPHDLEQQMQYGQHDEQRSNLQTWLLAGEYDGLALCLTDHNQELYQYLRRWTGSITAFDASAAARAHREHQHRPRFEVIMCMLLRMLNFHAIPYLTVLLSLFALKCCISEEYFGLLSSLGVLMGRTWTRTLAKELGDIVVHPRSYPRNASRWVGKAVYDNLLLPRNTDYESYFEEYCRNHYQTTQWTSVALCDVDDDAVARDFNEFGGWNNREGNFHILDHLDNPLADAAYTRDVWTHSMSYAVEKEPAAVLHHPDYTPSKSVRAVDHAHIPTKSAHRTYSHQGHSGCNVAYDHLRETRNGDLKKYLADGAAPGEIDDAIRILNGINSVSPHLRAALGRVREQAGESLREHQEDIDHLVKMLKRALPREFDAEASNPFGSGEPWSKVERERGGVREAVKKHLSRADIEMYV